MSKKIITIKSVEKKKDWLGNYSLITTLDGERFIERFFKELGLSVRVKL